MVAQAHMTIKIGRVLIGLTVIGILIGLAALASWADDGVHEPIDLQGLPGVCVLVEVRPAIEQMGVSKQQLQTDVELQLRQAGIRVFTQEEWSTAPGRPDLYVIAQGLYVFAPGLLPPNSLATSSNSVSILQQATLDINTSSTRVITWSVTTIATVEVARLSQAVRKDIRDLVDKFIKAYLNANPRPTGSHMPSSASPWRDLIRQVQGTLTDCRLQSWLS